MISVVDYDAGNIRSVMNALSFLSREAALTCDPREIERADFVVLPGVGSFGAAVRSLKERDLFSSLGERLYADRPTLGICLGMQLLFESSEESPDEKGFGFFDGRVTRLLSGKEKVPHIGWSTVENCNGVMAPFEGEYFYFVHSFAAPSGRDGVSAVANYGCEFAAAVQKGRVAAFQFHPEKSGRTGLALLERTLTEAGV